MWGKFTNMILSKILHFLRKRRLNWALVSVAWDKEADWPIWGWAENASIHPQTSTYINIIHNNTFIIRLIWWRNQTYLMKKSSIWVERERDFVEPDLSSSINSMINRTVNSTIDSITANAYLALVLRRDCLTSRGLGENLSTRPFAKLRTIH